MGQGNPYKKNNGRFGSASDHDYIIYEPNKERDIARSQWEAKELTGRDNFDEQFRNDQARGDYEPRQRDNTPAEPLMDKQLKSLYKRLKTIEESSKPNTKSLRKLQDEVKDLRERTKRSDLDDLLSRISHMWNELR